MKLITFLLLCFVYFSLFGQENPEEFTKAKLNYFKNYFEENIHYPEELINVEDAFLILSFHVNEQGILDSVKLDSTSHEILVSNGVKALKNTENNWHPTLLDGIIAGHWYKLVIYYNNIGGVHSISGVKHEARKIYEKAEKHYSRHQLNKALKRITEAIEIQQYEHSYFHLRSQILDGMDKKEESKKDLLTAKSLYMNVFQVVNINYYFLKF